MEMDTDRRSAVRPFLTVTDGTAVDSDLVLSDIDLSKFKTTDAGNAELFAALYGDTVRYDHARKKWYVFNGVCWRPDTTRRVLTMAKEAARTRGTVAFSLSDRADREAHVKWALASEQAPALRHALEIASALDGIAVTGDEWDTNTMLFAVANGVVELEAGTLRPGRSEDHITLQSSVEYDESATASRWSQFVREVFDNNSELIEWFQRFVGYCLTGETREHVIVFFHGSGANGKSVLQGTLLALFGEYGATVRFQTLEAAKRTGEGATPDIVALLGKRFVAASEVGASARMDEARVKSLTGGDRTSGRALYGNVVEFTLQAKYALAVNHKPAVWDNSDGFWRRVRLVPFTQQFTTDADPSVGDTLKADPTLGDTLKRELPGILNWAIEGCLAWQRQGLEPTPAVVREAVDDYRTEADVLAEFLTSACETDATATTGLTDLYAAYSTWADDNSVSSRERLGRNTLARRLDERYKRGPKRDGACFVGIALKTNAAPVPCPLLPKTPGHASLAVESPFDDYDDDIDDVPF